MRFPIVTSLLFVSVCVLGQSRDFTQYVNPFIGTGGHGHTFPGATSPFGMVQVSPDCRKTGWDWCSGYHYSDTTILGFSHTHLSGTGIGDLGDILIMPFQGKVNLVPFDESSSTKCYASNFTHSKEYAKPGYYKVELLKHNILAEMTATAHTAFHQYTFRNKSDSSGLVLDLYHGLQTSHTILSELNIESNTTVSGYRFSTGWAPERRVYFVIQFSKPFSECGISLWNQPLSKMKVVKGNNVKTFFKFSTTHNETLLVKVGLSFTSLQKAKEHLLQELGDKDFSSICEETKSKWNYYLSKIEIEASQKTKEIFYTSLYHCLIAPNLISDFDYTYWGPDFNIHKSSHPYYSTFSLWDTYRALHPLYTILMPEVVKDFVNSMLLHSKIYGYLPIWTLGGTENYCMIGNHAVAVIVEAIEKGIEGIDIKTAYQEIKKTLTTEHFNSPWAIYNQKGYIPYNHLDQSVSRTLEMCYDDWCAAMLARKLSLDEDYTFFLNRSQNYKLLFDTTSGFFRAKDENGHWRKFFDPIKVDYNGDYTEANAWQYLWHVLHDIPSLIDISGGVKKFEKKLDSLFSLRDTVAGNVHDISGLIGQYAHGNEPCHHVPYLYNYVGSFSKTQSTINLIIEKMYDNSPSGIPGNDDCGQMSAWYVFNCLGFYPVNPVSGFYDLGAPQVEKAVIHLNNGKKFIITTERKNKKTLYYRTVLLNNKKIKSPKISHSDILNGSTLKFIY